MPNLFDLYTVPPKSDSFGEFPMLSATGISNVDTNLDFDYSFSPKPLEINREELFKQALVNLGQETRNAPAYTFTDSMAKRYDIPGLQYTPYKTALGTDLEDLYAKNQEWYKKIGNGLLKGVANLGGTFASSFLTMPAVIDQIRDGKYVEAFQDDSLFSDIQQGLMNLEEVLPNYYSEWEREHPYLSAIPFVEGSANFWGDKVIKNLGFTVGSIAAGVVQGAAITYLTGGTGTGLGIARAGGAIAKALPQLFRGMRNVSKIAQSTAAVQNMGTMLRVGKNMSSAIEASAGLANIGKASKFLATTFLASQGEAFIEGYHTYNDIKNDYYKKLLNNEITIDEAKNVEQIAQDAGRYTAGVNLVLLSLSNAIQFPKLLGARPGNEFIEAFTKVIQSKEGLSYAANYNLKKAALRTGTEFIRDAITEGGEEFSQAITSGAITDYYMDKFAPAREGIVYHINNQLKKEGVYEEAFIGAISGALMGGISSVRENFIGATKRVNDTVSNINRAIGKLDDHTRLIHSAIDSETEVDQLRRQHSSFKYKFNMARQAVRFGTFDMMADSFRDTTQLPLNEFNELFNTNLKTREEQVQKVESLIEELDSYASVVTNVDRTFSKNPYVDKSSLSERIRISMGGDPEKIKKTQQYLFEEWKGAMAYSIARVQAINESLEGIQQMMGTFGYSDESYLYLKLAAAGDKKVIPMYSAFKTAQINALLQERNYLDSMREVAPAGAKPGTRASDYQNKIQQIDERIEKINENLKKIKTLSSEIPDNVDESQAEQVKAKQDELLDILMSEEGNVAAFVTKAEEQEKRKQIAEAAKRAAAEEQEKENLNKAVGEDGTKLAEAISVVEEAAGDSTATPQEVPIQEDPDAWIDNYEMGDIISIMIGDKQRDFTVYKVNPREFIEGIDSPPSLFLKSGASNQLYELKKTEDNRFIFSVDVSRDENNSSALIPILEQRGFSRDGTIYSKEVTIVESTQPQEAQSDIEAKKADIEKRRQEELDKKQKFTINRGNKDLEQAPEISFSEIDVEKSGLDFDNNEVDKVKVLELRGRNTQGQRVGTVRIQGTTKEGQPFVEEFEVFFNDDKINAKYDAELARELYKEMKAGKIVTDMTPAEQQVAHKYITEELRKSVDAELAASEQKTVDSIQDKKADIERRRQEELKETTKTVDNTLNLLTEAKQYGKTPSEAIDGIYEFAEKDGRKYTVGDSSLGIGRQVDFSFTEREQEIIDELNKLPAEDFSKPLEDVISFWEQRKEKYLQYRGNKNKAGVINAKYDAELAALEQTQPAAQPAQSQPVEPAAAQQQLEADKTSEINEILTKLREEEQENIIKNYSIGNEVFNTSDITESNLLFVATNTREAKDNMPVYMYDSDSEKMVRYRLDKSGGISQASQQSNIPAKLKQLRRASNEKTFSLKKQVTQAEIEEKIKNDISTFLGEEINDLNTSILAILAKGKIISFEC